MRFVVRAIGGEGVAQSAKSISGAVSGVKSAGEPRGWGSLPSELSWKKGYFFALLFFALQRIRIHLHRRIVADHRRPLAHTPRRYHAVQHIRISLCEIHRDFR